MSLFGAMNSAISGLNAQSHAFGNWQTAVESHERGEIDSQGDVNLRFQFTDGAYGGANPHIVRRSQTDEQELAAEVS